MNKGNIFVISGPSGVGKDTIVECILKEMPNIRLSISYTSREKRENEIEGRDYFFITKEEFKQKIEDNEFLEYAMYSDNYYGTSKKQVQELLNNGLDVILIIEVEGAKKIKKIIPDATFIFIMPHSIEELKKRLEKRKTESKEEIPKRLSIAEKEMKESKNYDYVVVNEDISNTKEKVKEIILSKK